MAPSGGRRPRGGKRPRGRALPPPDATGDEARYIQQLKEARTPLVIRLANGEEVRGYIEYFDRVMIKITRSEGPHLFLRKDEIRYWSESS